MPRYQLRISKGQQFVNLFDSMVKKAWKDAEKHFDPRKIQPEDYADFEEATRRTLHPYISTYDLCGIAVECSDEVEGAPYLDCDDEVYHLVFPDTFDEFLGQLSYAAFHSVKHLPKSGMQSAVYEVIENAFRQELADHLFYNPACGRIELCSFSRYRDPWKH